MESDFPNCVVSVDGKHIRCINLRAAVSNFFNYKNFFSVVLIAIADTNLRFLAINLGAYGKERDSIFSDTPLGKELYSNTLDLPPSHCLPNTSADPQSFVMVGDEAIISISISIT